MSIRARLELINLDILNGCFEQAKRDLQSLNPTVVAEFRMKAHFETIIMFREGQVENAARLMCKTLEDYGENVNLLRDLVVCQYHLLDMIGFRQGLNKLELLLLEKEALLSARSLLECELMVGKFLEEEARLAPALIFYDRALLRCQKPEQRLRALTQKARWHALYESSSELSSMYRELISYPSADITQDFQIELQHSLMLIELRLIGGDHAWQRITGLGPEIAAIDRRLLVFDFIEGILAQERSIAPAVLEIMNEFKELDPFEKFLRKSVNGAIEASAKIEELAGLASQLPWASYLRLLCLSANLETSESVKQELNRKIQLIVRSLDPRSQALWNQRLKQALQNPEIKIKFSARSRSIAIQGKTLDLSKKKMSLQLLEGLVRTPVLSVDEAIELLWKSSFSPEHYHRLRMGIHRLNTQINEITGLGKIIEVDSQDVRLRPEVKLKQADDVFEVGLSVI